MVRSWFSFPRSTFFILLTCSALVSGAANAESKKSASVPDEDGVSQGPEHIVFPPWTPDSFDWTLGLIAGGRTRSTETDGVKYDTVSSEIGLGARVRGIPVFPGNPGLTLEPYGTYTWGNRSQKAKNESIDKTDSSGFQRNWYGVLARIYYQSFRYSLDIGSGHLTYDDPKFADLKALRISNDFGFLLLSHLSTHYTLTSFTLTEGTNSDPSIEELDHWIHERLAFSLFSSSLDIGPGVTHTTYSGRADAGSPFQKIATVDTTYLKALASFNLIWRLGLSGSAKYILTSDENSNIPNTINQLPNESLAENRSLANLPKGSLEASLFIGFRQLIGGLGLGWQIYYLELNNDKSPKQISRDEGLVVTYGASI
ncbi:MAG: hypothetical protein H7249_04325 [Chitinophagaceae bacterium]|nr:hypothetical protein [Oligoflexus sp.]